MWVLVCEFSERFVEEVDGLRVVVAAVGCAGLLVLELRPVVLELLDGGGGGPDGVGGAGGGLG